MNNKQNNKTHLIIVLSVIVSLICIWIFEIMTDKIPYADQWTRGYVDYLDGTLLFYLLRGVTDFGSRNFLIPFVLIGSVILLVVFKRIIPALMFSLGTYGTHLLNELIKAIVRRDRPSIWVAANAEGFSFPSGHSMVTVVCYGLFIYYLNKKIKSGRLKKLLIIATTLLILLIGFSRYVINVHYLTDILTGFSIGGACLLLLITMDQYIIKNSDLRRR